MLLDWGPADLYFSPGFKAGLSVLAATMSQVFGPMKLKHKLSVCRHGTIEIKTSPVKDFHFSYAFYRVLDGRKLLRYFSAHEHMHTCARTHPAT